MAANVSFIMGRCGSDMNEEAARSLLLRYNVEPIKVAVKYPFALVTVTPDDAALFEANECKIPLPADNMHLVKLDFEANSINAIHELKDFYVFNIRVKYHGAATVTIDKRLTRAVTVTSSENG